VVKVPRPSSDYVCKRFLRIMRDDFYNVTPEFEEAVRHYIEQAYPRSTGSSADFIKNLSRTVMLRIYKEDRALERYLGAEFVPNPRDEIKGLDCGIFGRKKRRAGFLWGKFHRLFR